MVTPVSSNTAVERCGEFSRVLRTRIGSPYVIAGMQALTEAGLQRVVGYEANGGFLTQSDMDLGARRLSALPTRDALLPIVATLLMAKERNRPVSALAAALAGRCTHSDRLQEFPVSASRVLLQQLMRGVPQGDYTALEDFLGVAPGTVRGLDQTDGLRVTLAGEEIVHLRASGNAPEFRCYTEAETADRAAELNGACLARISRWLRSEKGAPG